jgi:2-polyprenyl-3-methyl-5-hydroxy-6-metoxy-1,4-benzoquinol methylase
MLVDANFELDCPACKGREWDLSYRGNVRFGKFPQSRTGSVFACKHCGLKRLDGKPVDYESPEYRALVDSDPSPAGYYRTHDHEQVERLEVIGLANLREKLVIDVGAGAGSFLDSVKGLASRTVAIEPARHFHAALREKGHEVFPFGADALPALAGQADLVTSFAVIEHVEDPLQFVRDLAALVRPGGQVLLSTPNARDWMIEFSSAYAQFYYRVVHRWYFDETNLSSLLQRVGFGPTRAVYRQRFDLSNALLWARDSKPTGSGKLSVLSALDGAYREELVRTGRADYLYLSATR